MSNASNDRNADSFFGEVISTYTRAQAIDDGVLIDVGDMAQEAGFKLPVAMTTAAWSDCVDWSADDSNRQVPQDQSGRLWDVLFMASHAIRTHTGQVDRLPFTLYRVPRDGHTRKSELAQLKVVIGPGDRGEPVITILLPNED
ncbi:DUF6573 family protein [Sedimenticola selenatireducens]|uniref:DUF6573 family protein n=1 Tax=Sedimenticola selenatireducens TaxID=191960 RepID=UPI00048BC5F3|nr:DUF6573 family protein [Sedimenticola selenatireducens]